MSNTFQKARKHLVPFKSLLREGDIKGAVKSLKASMETALTGKATKGELLDLASIWDKAVYAANFDKEFRKICPEGVHYEKGLEKRFLEHLDRLLTNADRVAEDNLLEEEAKKSGLKKQILEKARQFLEAGQPKKVSILIRKTAKSRPDDFTLLAEPAKMLMDAKQFDAAADGFTAALDINPDDVVTLNRLGGCFRHLGKHDRAAECYAKALAIAPDDEGLLFNSARNAIDGRMWTEAHDALKKAIEINPDFTPAKKALKAVEKKIFM